MFITKMSLPRRTFLRGLGATLALPLLDAMVPALSALAATAAKPARRLGFVYVPNGVIQDQWVPATVGAGFELSPTLSPLAAGARQAARAERPVAATGRVVRRRQRRSCARQRLVAERRPPEADRRRRRPGRHDHRSDRRQRARASDTRLPSLELALESQERSLGSCDNGYACVYINTISWRTPTSPVPMEIHPRVVFDRLFGDGGNAAARLAQVRRTHSILDSVQQEAARLQRTLGAGDRTKVNEYLEAVREVEQRIQRAERQTGELSLDLPDRPTDIPENFDEHMRS